MSDWIDPLGARLILHAIHVRQMALKTAYKHKQARNPASRTAAKMMARSEELHEISALIHAVLRPGVELRPHKDLVNVPGRRELIKALGGTID